MPLTFMLACGFVGGDTAPSIRVEVRSGEDPKPMVEVLDSRGVEMALKVPVVKEDKAAWATIARAFSLDCAERALQREISAGREPDRRSLAAIRIAKLYASGDAFDAELKSAESDAFAVLKVKLNYQYADWAAVHFAEPAWPGDYDLGAAGYAAKAAASNRAAWESAKSGNLVSASLAEVTAAAAAAWAVADAPAALSAGSLAESARGLFWPADAWPAFVSHMLEGPAAYQVILVDSDRELAAWKDERVWQQSKLRSYLDGTVVPEVYASPVK